MTRKIIQTVIAFLLVACGWAVGRAQTPAPEFTLTIDAPGGRTMVKCVRPQYSFECSGVTQCSATVNGWLKH
jgi:hypothetical protein